MPALALAAHQAPPDARIAQRLCQVPSRPACQRTRWHPRMEVPICKKACCSGDNIGRLSPLVKCRFNRFFETHTEGTHYSTSTKTAITNWNKPGTHLEIVAQAHKKLLGDKLFRKSTLAQETYRSLFPSGPCISLCDSHAVSIGSSYHPQRAAALKVCGRDFAASKTKVFFLDTELFYGHRPCCYRCSSPKIVRDGWSDLKRVAGWPDGEQLFVYSARWKCEKCSGDPGNFPECLVRVGTSHCQHTCGHAVLSCTSPWIQQCPCIMICSARCSCLIVKTLHACLVNGVCVVGCHPLHVHQHRLALPRTAGQQPGRNHPKHHGNSHVHPSLTWGCQW